MLELDDPATEHARIGRLIAAMPIDVVHVCGAYADTVLAEVEPGQRGLSAPKALDLFTGIAQSIHGVTHGWSKALWGPKYTVLSIN